MGDDQSGQERLDRNWDELLQELRVTQTGVQILTGFLLTVPFSSRFEELDRLQLTTYLAVLTGAIATTAFVIAPVAFHRLLFRQNRRDWIVEAANICARVGLVLLAVTVSGALFLVFEIVVGLVVGLVTLGVTLVFFLVLWVLVPLRKDRRTPG
ncbi:DUF6328 family protein [Nocardioides bigeumensis]|uniref:DUF6328 family protein n=1 Tax=Nocardioides bigeumensis TaxID=433657 RepID=A0ABP5JFQ4_9ACTN